MEQRGWSQEETGLSGGLRLSKTSFTWHFTGTCLHPKDAPNSTTLQEKRLWHFIYLFVQYLLRSDIYWAPTMCQALSWVLEVLIMSLTWWQRAWHSGKIWTPETNIPYIGLEALVCPCCVTMGKALNLSEHVLLISIKWEFLPHRTIWNLKEALQLACDKSVLAPTLVWALSYKQLKLILVD